MSKKTKNLLILLGLVVVVVIVVITISNNNKTNINTVFNSQKITKSNEEEDNSAEEVAVSPVLKGAVAQVPGGNLVTTDNKVVTIEGNEVKNDVEPMSPDAPHQTAPISKDELSKSVIKIEMTAAGFNPSEFTVKKGEIISLAITSGDEFTHVFRFDDKALSAIAVGVASGETRAITFKSSVPAGDYAFHCDVLGHAARGETGKMIVK